MRDMGYRMRVAGCAILFLLLGGCSSLNQSVPEWVVRPQVNYPEAQYLVAIGEGDTRRAAENSATAGLARIFESRIRAEESLSETTTETRGTAETFDQFSELRADIRIGSEQNLLNIQFGDSFTDTHGRVYVAACLPRAETAEIYRTRIGENSRAIAHLIRESDRADDPLETYAFRRAATRKALENDLLMAQLDIILPAARKQLLLDYDPQTLYSETAAAARHVTFSVKLSGESGDTLREALTGMGFSESNDAVLRFTGSATFEETDLRRGSLVFVRCRYQIDIDTGDGSQILSLSGAHREGHINYEQAADRARRSLRKEILDKIPKKLGDCFDRLAALKY